MTETKEVIKRMLTENTGSHFLDSGGAYGRNWSRNQGIDFDKTPQVTVENFGDNIPIFTVSVYHYLLTQLEWTKESHNFNRRLHLFSNSPKYKDEYWCDCLNAWAKLQGIKVLDAVNTYNEDSLLSQVLQYWTFEHDNCMYVILQIHGGCDVRGGYTSPKVFEICNGSDSECLEAPRISGYTIHNAPENQITFSGKDISIAPQLCFDLEYDGWTSDDVTVQDNDIYAVDDKVYYRDRELEFTFF